MSYAWAASDVLLDRHAGRLHRINKASWRAAAYRASHAAFRSTIATTSWTPPNRRVRMSYVTGFYRRLL